MSLMHMQHGVVLVGLLHLHLESLVWSMIALPYGTSSTLLHENHYFTIENHLYYTTLIRFCRFDADQVNVLAKNLAIEALPTFVLIKNCKIVEKLRGWNEPALIKMIDKHGGVRKKVI